MLFRPLLAGSALIVASTFAAADTPKFAADVPDSVLTPDQVETNTLGNFEFFTACRRPRLWKRCSTIWT